jgi:hypothetical protein
MKSKFLFIFLLIFLSIYSQKPDWVTSRPLEQDFFIGIGFASKVQGRSEHFELARMEALKNLASEIVINVSGEIVSNMLEKSGLVEDELRSSIRTSTQAELEGYEIIDEWQDDKQYWVYYRLSKTKYYDLKQATLQKAISLSLNLFSQAKKSETANQYEKALLYYLKALNPIEKHIGETLQTEFDGKTIYLNHELYYALQNLLSNITLKPVQPKIQVKRNQSIKTQLTVQALYQNDIPIANLPVSFSFTKGEGELIRNLKTNMDGQAFSILSRIKAQEKMQMISIIINTKELTQQDSTSLIYDSILKTLHYPAGMIMLEVSGPVFIVHSEELNFNEPLQTLQVGPKLKEALSQKGFGFTNDVINADYMIELEAKSRQGSEMLGMFSAFVDVKMTVFDIKNSEEIYSNVFNNVSGQGLSYEKAGLKAFQIASEKCINDFIPKLEKLLH